MSDNTPAKRASTELLTPADIAAQMASEMENVKDRIGAIGGTRIVAKDKMFTLPDGSTSPTIDVVVLEFTNRNMFYEDKYDPKSIVPPSCYAVGPSIADLIPAENVEDKQAESCNTCPMNEFGSSGRGKACKNTRRLAVLPADSTSPSDDIMTIDVSPTAIKRFDKIVSDLRRDANVLPIGIIMELGFDNDSDYTTLTFSPVGPNENLPLHWSRRAEAAELINQLIDYEAFESAAPAKSKKAVTRRR